MGRVPVLVFGILFAMIGVLAASSVYVTERNDVTMKTAGIAPAPTAKYR